MDAIAAQARHRPRRGAPPQPDRQDGDAVRAPARARSATESSTTPATTRRCSTRRWRASTGTRCKARLARAPRRRRDWSAPGSRCSSRRAGSGPTDGVRISVDPTGAVEVVTGGASLGQGFETVMAQICADALGVDYRRVRVVHGQTDRIEYGIGAHASRATVMTGSATHVARAQGARARRSTWRRELMQTPADDARHRRRPGGAQGPRRRPVDRRSARWRGTSRRLEDARRARARAAAEGWFHTEHMAYPYGVQVAVVKVDRDTGGVTVERYLIAYDVGRAVNPMLVEGPARRRLRAGARRRAARRSSSTTSAASRSRPPSPTT